MNAVLALIARLFALYVLWSSVVYFIANMHLSVENWSVMDAYILIFTLFLILFSLIVVIKPKILIKGIPVDNEPEALNNLSIYHAGLVVAGMIMVYFSLTALIQAISYWYFVDYQMTGQNIEGVVQMQMSMKSTFTTVVFKNIFAFAVLLGAKGWAKIFYNLREVGLEKKANNEF